MTGQERRGGGGGGAPKWQHHITKTRDVACGHFLYGQILSLKIFLKAVPFNSRNRKSLFCLGLALEQIWV